MMKHVNRYCVGVLSFALLAGCPAKKMSPGDGGENPDDGGNVGSDELAQTKAFFDAVSTIWCDGLVKCARMRPEDRDACVSSHYFPQQIFVEDLNLGAVSRGTEELNDSAAKSCLAAYQYLSDVCEIDREMTLATDHAACRQIFVSVGATGQACERSFECANPGEGCSGNLCGGQCVAAGGLGQPCDNQLNCELGLICDFHTRLCAKRVSLGSRCSYHSECDRDAYCYSNGFSGVCAPKVAEGAKCSNSSACNDSTYCSDSQVCTKRKAVGELCTNGRPFDESQCLGGYCYGEPLTCRAFLSLGETCGTGSQCAPNLYCPAEENGKLRACRALSTNGEKCTADYQCAKLCPECLSVCDPVQGVCRNLRGRSLAVGDECIHDYECPSAGYSWFTTDAGRTPSNVREVFTCIGLGKNPDGGSTGGTRGHCRAQVKGSACTWDDECPANMICSRDICVPSVLNSPCQESVHCPEGLYCTGEGTCGEIPSKGELCRDECRAPSSCVFLPVSDAGFNQLVCLELGILDDGASCTSTSDCKFPMNCGEDHRCRGRGRLGDPCLRDCVDGYCAQPDSKHAGTCTSLGKPGADCKSDFHCESLQCRDSKCAERVCKG